MGGGRFGGTGVHGPDHVGPIYGPDNELSRTKSTSLADFPASDNTPLPILRVRRDLQLLGATDVELGHRLMTSPGFFA